MTNQLQEIIAADSDEKWIITYNKGGSYGTVAFKGTIGQWVVENTVQAEGMERCHLISAHKVSDNEFNVLYNWL